MLTTTPPVEAADKSPRWDRVHHRGASIKFGAMSTKPARAWDGLPAVLPQPNDEQDQNNFHVVILKWHVLCTETVTRDRQDARYSQDTHFPNGRRGLRYLPVHPYVASTTLQYPCTIGPGTQRHIALGAHNHVKAM